MASSPKTCLSPFFLTNIAWLVLLLSSLVDVKADETGYISLKRILPRLIGGGKIVGLETDCLCRDQVSIQKIDPFIKSYNFGEICAIIQSETDYECLLGADYMVIFPKPSPSEHDRPLVLREVAFPSVKGMQQDDFYSQIRGANSKEPVAIAPYPLVSPFFVTDGIIKIGGASPVCYAALNQVAMQLRARFWTIDHMFAIDKGQKRPILPVNLSFGWIAFQK